MGGRRRDHARGRHLLLDRRADARLTAAARMEPSKNGAQSGTRNSRRECGSKSSFAFHRNRNLKMHFSELKGLKTLILLWNFYEQGPKNGSFGGVWGQSCTLT